MAIRSVCLIVLLVLCCFAVTGPILIPLTVYQQPNGAWTVDDTFECTAWSGTTAGGNFSGGRLFCTGNDAAYSGVPSNLMMVEVTGLGRYTSAGTTIVLTNSMTSYGDAGGNVCFGGTLTCKSSDPWFWNNIMYWNITSSINTDYGIGRSALIMSPDFGAHWCNLQSYITGKPNGVGASAGTPYTCSGTAYSGAPNWSATGDMATGDPGVQWPLPGDATRGNKMGKLLLVQTCQDNSIACPTIAGLSNQYVYFVSAAIPNPINYLHRFDKSCSPAGNPGVPSPMLPECWTHWDGSTWNATYTNSAALTHAFGGDGGIIWLPVAGRFAQISGGTASLGQSWSTDLLSWNTVALLNCSLVANNCPGGFPTPILATYQYNTYEGESFMVSSDDGASLKHGFFTYIKANPSRARGGVQ